MCLHMNNNDDNNKGRERFMYSEGHAFVMFNIDALFMWVYSI